MNRKVLIIMLCSSLLSGVLAAPVTTPSLSSYVKANVSWWDSTTNTSVSIPIASVEGSGQAVAENGISWANDPQSPVGRGATSAYYGWMQSHATVNRAAPSVLADPDWYLFGMIAGSRFEDTITLSSPGLEGTQGTATFIFEIDGTVRSSRSGANATAGLFIKNVSLNQVLFNNSYLLPGGGRQEYVSLPFPITYGEPFSFLVTFSTFASLAGPEAGEIQAEFGDTARFSGMDVFDSENNRVTNFTITSESGAAYPIPDYRPRLLYDPARAVKRGATIPIKLQVRGADDQNVSSAAINVHAVSITKASGPGSWPVEDAGRCNPNDDFRFDPRLGRTGGYIFNLKTRGDRKRHV
jgi:hypothetical protein